MKILLGCGKGRGLAAVALSGLAAFSFAYAQAPSVSAPDWPQVQRNAQHTGFYPEPVFPFSVKNEVTGHVYVGYRPLWNRNFGPDSVAHCVQPIIVAGRVFVATKQGNVYALDAYAGKELWKFSCGSPLVRSVGVEGGTVFFGALNGRVYALSVEDGAVRWTAECGAPGFSASPVLAEGKVFIGSRSGKFYAFDQAAGRAAWELALGAPVASTAAYNAPQPAAAGGRVYVAAENMRCYALDAETGAIVWQSEQLPGQSFKALFPVVYKGKVFLMPNMSVSYELSGVQKAAQFSYGGQHSRMHTYEGVGKNRADPAWDFYQDGLLRGDLALFEREQAALAEATQAKPSAQCVLVLAERDGTLLPAPPQSRCAALSGPEPPPALDAFGTLVMSIRFFDSTFGRFDADRMRFVDPFLLLRYSNSDEDRAASCCGPLVFIMHIMEGNAAVSGVYDLRLRNLLCEIGSPPGDTRLQSAVHETGSPHAVSFYDNMWFHISGHRLAAWRGAPRLRLVSPQEDFRAMLGKTVQLKAEADEPLDEKHVEWRVSCSVFDYDAAVMGRGLTAEFLLQGELPTLAGERMALDYTDVDYALELHYRGVMQVQRRFRVRADGTAGRRFGMDAKPAALPFAADFSAASPGGLFRAFGRHESGYAAIEEEDGNRFLVLKEARFFLPLDLSGKDRVRVRFRMRFKEGGAMCGMPASAAGAPVAGAFFDTEKALGTWGQANPATTWLACIDGDIAREPTPEPGNVALNVWHELEYRLRPGEQKYDMWFNGREIIQNAAFHEPHGEPAGLVFQNRKLPFSAGSADRVLEERWICHVDDVEISAE